MIKLILTDENGHSEELLFRDNEIRIGRSKANNLCLNSDLRVSSEHAKIIIRGDLAFLADLNSTNGTLLNSERVSGKEYQLKNNDVIRIGRSQIDFFYQDSMRIGDHYKVEEAANKPTIIKPSQPSENKIEADSKISKVYTDSPTVLTPEPQDADDSTKKSKIHSAEEIKIIDRYLSLNKAAQTINSCLDISTQLETILDEAMALLDAQEGFMISFDKNSKSIKVEAMKQIDHMKKFNPFFSRQVVNQCISRGKSILLAEAFTNSKDFENSESMMNIASILCVPIRFADEILGVIYLDDKKNLNKFNEDDMELLSAFASHCAVAMKNASLIERVRRDERKMASLQRFLPHNIASKVADATIMINLGGEKRECSIMFTDIRFFSSISEKLRPQEIVNLLNEYFSSMVNIIFSHQGTLDKFLGDGIMAIFGAPVAIGNDALFAVKTAIEMQEAVRALNLRKLDEKRPTFEIGIGIDTGEVIAGNIGSDQRMEYTVIGNPVNVSSRLCGLCNPGQIMISENTFQKIKNTSTEFKTDFLGEKKLKNISQPVRTYEIKYSII